MIYKLALTITSIISTLGAVTGATAGEGYWSRAGTEIGEAAGAVSDATVETSKDAWSATKRGTGKAWDKTKEVSGDAWDSTKEVVHDGADYVEEQTAD